MKGASRKTKEVYKKIFTPPMHAHPSYFGSELACRWCNPYCYQNHGMGCATWCGDEDCPMNPKNQKQLKKYGK